MSNEDPTPDPAKGSSPSTDGTTGGLVDQAASLLGKLPRWAQAGLLVCLVGTIGVALVLRDDEAEPSQAATDARTDTADEDAFFEEYFAANLDLDDTGISDATLLGGGREWCTELSEAAESGTDPDVDGATFEDFEAIAEELARTRFEDARGTSGSDGNAQILVSYTVGTAAVHNLCPEHTAALG